jgi:signal transduction histidine kinase
MTNAVEAISEKGEITVTTLTRDRKLYIRIRDTGVGIPAEDISRVFDPGFTTKGVGVGTGLGLAICYQVVADHHGEIRVESSPGRGSTFTIVLPVDAT